MSWLPVDNEEFILETRNASPSHLLTKIESFSKLSKHGISKLESAEFEAGDYKWKVIIYPDGDKVGEKAKHIDYPDGDKEGKKANHISVHLSIVGTSSLPAGWEVNAIFNFFLYDHIKHNYLCFRGKAQRFQAINPEVRLSKFMDKPTLLDPSKGYVFEDSCVFGAEVFVIQNQRYVEMVSVFDVEAPYKHEWEIADFSKLENVWSSEEFSTGGYNWKIKLYPNGESSARGRYVSIFLECIDSNSFAARKKVKVTCSFCFKNMLKDKEDYSMKFTHWFKCLDVDRGYLQFKAISDLHDGFVVKDCCRLEVQVSVDATQEALD